MAIGDKIYLGTVLDKDNNSYKAIMFYKLTLVQSLLGPLCSFRTLDDDNYIYEIGGYPSSGTSVKKINKATMQMELVYDGTGSQTYMVQDAEYIYLANMSNYIIKLRKSDLTQVAKSSEAYPFSSVTHLAMDDTHIYVSSNSPDGVLCKFNKSDLSKVLQTATIGCVAKLAMDNDFIYASEASNKKICKYKKSDLSKVAEQTVTNAYDSLVYANGYLYCGYIQDSTLSKLNAVDLALKNSVNLIGYVSTICYHDGKIYVGGNEKMIRIYDEDLMLIESCEIIGNPTATSYLIEAIMVDADSVYAAVSDFAGLYKLQKTYSLVGYEKVV